MLSLRHREIETAFPLSRLQPEVGEKVAWLARCPFLLTPLPAASFVSGYNLGPFLFRRPKVTAWDREALLGTTA